MTPEQQKALALAKARKRKKQKLEQSTLSGMVDSFTNQAVGGLGPILTAGEAAVLGRTPEGDFFNFEESMSKRFNDALAAERAQNEQFNEDHFIASTAAGIPGAVVAGGGVGAVGRKVAPKVANTLSSSLPGRLVAGAGAGSALGAGNAVGQGKDVVTNAVVGAASGLAGQAAGEVLTRGGSAAIGALRRKPKIPTVEKLRDAQQAAYRIAGQQDILYSQTAIRGLRDKVMRQFAKRGFHPSRHPGAADVIEELNRLSEAQLVAGQGITTARKLFNDAWKAGKKENNSLVGAAVREMDNMIRNPKSAVHGDAKVFSKHLRAGNEASRRLFKLEEADELSSRAGRRAARTGSGGNVENTTRQELSKILDQAKRSRSFKPDELEVIEKIVMGTPTQNALRLAGKLSPEGNGLMMALLGGTGFIGSQAGSTAITAGAATAAGAGFLAKRGAEAMGRGQMSMLDKIIRAGGEKIKAFNEPNLAQKFIDNDANRQLVRNALILLGVGEAQAN